MVTYQSHYQIFFVKVDLTSCNLPPATSKIGEKILTYANVKIWNNEVPLDLKKISTYKTFTKKYKEFLLSNLE